jgi:murein DD-endopeptidase MepM/ murein hydrolase activator NlpD
VSSGYNVTPEVIINWEGNNLDPVALGDWSHPNIEPGTMLFVPDGSRSFVTWSAPRITRENPGVAKILGPGSCGTIVDGAVGIGSFIWPSNSHYVGGYPYSPSTNHFGVDISGSLGDAIYAADNGVVVYAGWNNWGYGYVVVIDHGNGWQTLYAHLSVIGVGCGQSVYQGGVIGAYGSTGNSSGPHLHFEMMHDSYGKVNPLNFLP